MSTEPLAGRWHNKTWFSIAAVYAALIIGLCLLVGGTFFSPDSWLYYDLSKTFLTGDIYQTKNQFYYFSETHSATFPFGVPFLIAAVNSIAGDYPYTGQWLNALAAMWGLLLLVEIGRRVEMPDIAILLLFTTIFCSIPFIDEILSGRSITIAIALWLAALWAFLQKRTFSAGLALGLAALCRFDFTIMGLLTIAGMQIISRDKLVLRMAAGFILGKTPWIIYSLLNFGTFWVSVQSWVALAAPLHFVVDFPPHARETLFTHPLQWTVRVLESVYVIAANFIFDVQRMLIFVPLFVLILRSEKLILNKVEALTFIMLWLLSFTGLAVSGFFLLGFADERYFLFNYFVLLLLILIQFGHVPLVKKAALWLSGAKVLTLFVFVAGTVALNTDRHNQADDFTGKLRIVEQCHLQNPSAMMIIENASLAAQYGAQSGLPTRLIPSNWQTLDSATKQLFHARYNPLFFAPDALFLGETLDCALLYSRLPD
ncbi:MAG: hypothetical protein LW855_02495 [Alphaproteobacteria bacterium]|jgi:hypothetical protein|nr:hypothetical protein [Thalassospira sp.]MCE2964642.1 hypothetical protein [Alphaproteobacteria bacterium]